MTQLLSFPPLFPVDEFRSRLTALRTLMAQRKVDILVVDQFEHMVYFGGYRSTAAMYQALLIPLARDPVAVIREIDFQVFNEKSWLTQVVAFRDECNPVKVVAETIKSLGLGDSVIGLERDSHFLTVERAFELESLLPDAKIVDFSRVVREMRQIKSPLELACLEVAAEICGRAAAAAFDIARPRINEREVFIAMASEAWRNGADNADVAVMASGPRSAILHASLGGHTFAEGDILHVEPVPHFRGYTSRMMRPKFIGRPSDSIIRTADAMIRIQDEQFRSMKPGAYAKDVDLVVREGMLAAGLRDSYTNVSGYTLGFTCPPRNSDFTRVFLPNSDWQLKENQVFHMYTSAQGMAFSETIVVTLEGGKRLTKMERRLFF